MSCVQNCDRNENDVMHTWAEYNHNLHSMRCDGSSYIYFPTTLLSSFFFFCFCLRVFIFFILSMLSFCICLYSDFLINSYVKRFIYTNNLFIILCGTYCIATVEMFVAPNKKLHHIVQCAYKSVPSLSGGMVGTCLWAQGSEGSMIWCDGFFFCTNYHQNSELYKYNLRTPTKLNRRHWYKFLFDSSMCVRVNF